MARIATLDKADKKVHLHDGVKTLWFSGVDSGEKIVQIDMYGRKDRDYAHQPSQLIQIDKKIAQQLVDILRKEFNI